MKILESSPSRYDRGIRILTLGTLDKAYDRLTSGVMKGQKVLDIGCGTGALTLRAARNGADVKGIDVNSQMLEIAQERAHELNLTDRIEFCEMGVAELGNEQPESYDVVMSGLCFSELTEDEVIYTLREIKRILKPRGILLIADETRPEHILKRMLSGLLRLPLVVITYLITQTSTSAIENLPARVRKAGFEIESLRTGRLGIFVELGAKNTGGKDR